jgi:predicted lipoprotein with Yx(FWY)xxD motif
MSQRARSRFSIPLTRLRTLAVAALCLSVLAVAGGATSNAAGQTSKRVTKKAENPTLGRTVLTTLGGRTLYTLSAETHGRFICTSACLAEWVPLTVPAGTRPTGPVALGTIVRPDNGRTQATFHGRPLYHFKGDRKAGDVNGESVKDVGTWHAATLPTPRPAPQPSPPAPENPYPY